MYFVEASRLELTAENEIAKKENIPTLVSPCSPFRMSALSLCQRRTNRKIETGSRGALRAGEKVMLGGGEQPMVQEDTLRDTQDALARAEALARCFHRRPQYTLRTNQGHTHIAVQRNAEQ